MADSRVSHNNTVSIWRDDATDRNAIDVFPVTVVSIADGNPGRYDPDFFNAELAVTDDPSGNQTLS